VIKVSEMTSVTDAPALYIDDERWVQQQRPKRGLQTIVESSKWHAVVERSTHADQRPGRLDGSSAYSAQSSQLNRSTWSSMHNRTTRRAAK